MPLPTQPVTCTFYDQGGNAIANARVTFKLTTREIYGGMVAPERIEATADATGVVVVNLFPNALGVAGSLYQVKAYNPDAGKFMDTFCSVPNSPCNLHQILTEDPYPAIDASQQALTAAQAAQIAATAQAVIATTQATTATTQAGIATTGASTATTQAGIATTQAAIATTQAGIATTQAGISTTKAGESNTSAIAAAASAAGTASAIVTERTAVATLTNKTLTSPVISTPTGIVKGDVGLGSVDNTSDANKPVSTAQATAIALKESASNKDASGGYPGLTLFKINIKNAANTFINFLTNATTAARTWTFPDKDGTVAMTSDFLAPGAIGSTTPGTGAFTSVSVADELSYDVATNNLPAIRPTLNADFANSRSVDPRITFTRASTATRVGPTGLIETVASGVPVIDYDPVTLAPKGLGIWGQRTNLVLNSTIDGANLATQNVTVAAVAHALSFYGTGTVTLSGTFAGSLVGAGAYPSRSTLTFTPTAGVLTLTVTGTVQFTNLEVGAFPTPYIPTVASQVTRATDVAVMTGANFSSWYRQDEGTFVCNFAASATTNDPSGPVIFGTSDGTFGNSQYVARLASSGTLITSVVAGGVSQVNSTTGSITASTTSTISVAYKLNDCAASLAGAAAVIDTLATIPTQTQMVLGSASWGAGANAVNGYIRRITYYPVKLASATLQTLST